MVYIQHAWCRMQSIPYSNKPNFWAWFAEVPPRFKHQHPFTIFFHKIMLQSAFQPSIIFNPPYCNSFICSSMVTSPASAVKDRLHARTCKPKATALLGRCWKPEKEWLRIFYLKKWEGWTFLFDGKKVRVKNNEKYLVDTKNVGQMVFWGGSQKSPRGGENVNLNNFPGNLL